MSTHLSQLAQLAAEISKSAKQLDEYLTTNNLPQPSFEIDAPVNYDYIVDPEARQAQLSLANAGRKLFLLMQSPTESFKFNVMTTIHTMGALQALGQFNVTEKVPFDKAISYDELASKTGLGLDMLTRCVRMASTSCIFQEKTPGYVSHTAMSKLLATEESTQAFITIAATEALPSIAKIAEALKSSPEGQVAPFDLAFGMPFFEHKKKNPAKSAVFAKVMAGTKKQNRGQEVVDVFDWDRFTGLLVDVGGSVGHLDAALAKQNPQLNFLTEDLPQLKEQAESYIQADGLSSQISFIAHDFFTPQPEQAKGANVYLLSHVIHDWPDQKCEEILRHVVKSMAPDSSLILVEALLPEPGQLDDYSEAIIRAHDMGMFNYLKAKQRSAKDLEKLMKLVDERLKIVKIVGPPTTRMNSVVEFAFRS
ncbi:S-adenosyl-L-methionine-dependent methyltransferase [Microthyrium microscopicum]|uniref:S-adenosyl-L-methionine-dependent methyltransferase n=1 Tax=Microthyrium microscopicum TaxID=703497 RepID=A0A6A6UK44_9PEZI|nr:S-adenosyl-L-methionine-dependent methyltransferase [Microthyrium microscopicum]